VNFPESFTILHIAVLGLGHSKEGTEMVLCRKCISLGHPSKY
jgi:hypothetical protein